MDQASYMYTFKPLMLNLMQDVGTVENTFSWKQAVQYFKDYICKKKLFNPQNPNYVCIENDPLRDVFNVSTIDLMDENQKKKLRILLASQLNPVKPIPALSASQGSSSPKRGGSSQNVLLLSAHLSYQGAPSPKGIKRKYSATESENLEKSSRQRPPSPMYLLIPPSPIYDSAEESAWSVQDLPTDIARNSGDSSSTSDCESDADSFAQEYDVVSLSSVNTSTTASDSNVELADLLSVKDGSDSDMPFWADHSESEAERNASDPEMTESDKWKCVHCNNWNSPPNGSCLKCFKKRTHWFEKRKKKRMSKKQRLLKLFQASQTSSQAEAMSSQSDGNSQKDSETAESSQSLSQRCLAELCQMCVTHPADGLISHGHSCHGGFCYGCARKLGKRTKSDQMGGRERPKCPLCRRNIEKIFRIL